jgi:hypothetical protein
MCDNCCNDHKQEIKDISKESQEIVAIISRNKSQKGFNLGMGKTLKLIQQSNTVIKKSVTWIRDII